MTEWLSSIAVLLTALFGVLTYFIQKHLDRQNILSAKKREIYSDFLGADAKAAAGVRDGAPLLYHALGQIAIYGSGPVVKAANLYIKAVFSQGQGSGKESDTHAAFRRLLLAMRSDVSTDKFLTENDVWNLPVGACNSEPNR